MVKLVDTADLKSAAFVHSGRTGSIPVSGTNNYSSCYIAQHNCASCKRTDCMLQTPLQHAHSAHTLANCYIILVKHTRAYFLRCLNGEKLAQLTAKSVAQRKTRC